MNHSSTLTLPSTGPKTGNPDVGLADSFVGFRAMASGGDKPAGDESMDSGLPPAHRRLIASLRVEARWLRTQRPQRATLLTTPSDWSPAL